MKAIILILLVALVAGCTQQIDSGSSDDAPNDSIVEQPPASSDAPSNGITDDMLGIEPTATESDENELPEPTVDD